MSEYEPTVWQRRVVQFPDRYAMTSLGGGLVQLVPSEGTVTQEGTPFTEDNLNKVELGLQAIYRRAYYLGG